MQNDRTSRDDMWRQLPGDRWDAFDALPPGIRQRLHEHAYDAWSVNALKLWRHFRRQRGHSVPAARTLVRYLDQCEALELAEFAARHRAAHGTELPHVAAGATTMRYSL